MIRVFLLMFILGQGCVTYNRTPVSLENATNKGKVKYITELGEGYVYKEIIEKEGIYYGIKPNRRVQLPDQDASVYLKNIKKSRILTIITVVLSIPASIGLFGWIVFGLGDPF